MGPDDDLVPLFTGQAHDVGISYRQGVLSEWNAGTFANVVTVAGASMTNLPVLLTTGLTAGAVVAVLAVGPRRDSWLILGKLNIPS